MIPGVGQGKYKMSNAKKTNKKRKFLKREKKRRSE